jgi:predicted transcriptional regulator
MARNPHEYLSKRGQQIMEIVYERGSITATDLEETLPGSPANSTVRTQLRTLEERGFLTHKDEEGRFVYTATRPKPAAAREVMKSFLRTFVDGSIEKALATLLSAKEADLTDEDLQRLSDVIAKAKQERSNE